MKPVDTQEVIIPDPSSLFYLIEPQWPLSNEKAKHKFWHFKFVKDETETQFTDVLKKLGKNITVTYNYVGKDKPDVSLTENGELIGKIQFIHFDRRDRKNTSKHYIKLYFIQFQPTLFERAKKDVVQFFDEKRGKKQVISDKTMELKEEPKEEPMELKEEPKESTVKPKVSLKKQVNKKQKSHTRKLGAKQIKPKEEPKELKEEPKEEPKEPKEPKKNQTQKQKRLKELYQRLNELQLKKEEILKKKNSSTIMPV